MAITGVSEVTAKAINAPALVPEILGQHHGFRPSVGGRRANDEVFGGPAWQQEREKLIEELKSKTGYRLASGGVIAVGTLAGRG